MLTSKTTTKWVCECGKINKEESKYCNSCSKDPYGFNVNAIKPKDVIELLEQKELALKISRRNLQHVWGETVDIRVLESFKLLYSGVKADFSNKRMNELVSHRNVLIDRFIEKYNYEDRSVVKNLRVEITTHLFYLIIRANNTWPVKLKQLFVWLVKIKPNIVRAFYIFLFKRTIFGTRIRKLFYIK